MPVPIPTPAITVLINGGSVFPNITQVYTFAFYPGITIAQALRNTGVVVIGFNGQIISVGGIPITDGITFVLSLNGRPIPSTLLNAPLQPGDSLELQLFFRPLRDDEEYYNQGTVQYEEERNYIDEDDLNGVD
ncbi:hypothetical protein PCCS19_25770 [Paenibacillus sp. CCS19]|uniref:hypothetical protein n=1 Tax=Paenibacillus sp. CCS19 TaxID=3158387 RepID=UPI00256D2E83|nr:hypothetical protein [Paenibacillus cellulosilyticus]GMK39523.1 hypothetical protein PCCS19_25770 [Paenibacillus cellulosilyticus]